MEKKVKLLVTAFLLLLLFSTMNVNAMHVSEGLMPFWWCIVWGVISVPFLIAGLYSIKKHVGESPKSKILLAMSGAFTFVLSALKIPSVVGSCSHPTGIGFGSILFGPSVMTVIGFIVLVFQALLLGHGGLTTLGANTFSMAIVGSFTAYYTFKALKKTNLPKGVCVFAAAFLSDLLTYVTTSVQLAAAFPNVNFMTELTRYLSIFAVTQLPIAVAEGLLTVVMFNLVEEFITADKLNPLGTKN